MEDFNISSELFMTELLNISTGIVWKNQSVAYSLENSLNSVDVEQYIAALKGMLSFDTVFQFAYSVLIGVGLTAEQAEVGMEDKRTIPENLRQSCTTAQIKYIKENYEEQNDYYRMLYGLPSLEDTTFLYNTKYPEISDNTTPIHLLPIAKRFSLENLGYFDELLELHPDKKYLKYLALKNIIPYTARIADRFAILWMASSDYANLGTAFVNVYNASRNTINRVYYTDAFRKDNSMYDGFLGMSILFMTIQLMHYKYLDADITRDFYDIDSIRYIYESYGVPFYPSIPLEYHTKIVKNINRLLSYKGSTRVFYELFDLFDYGSMNIYEYYILKTHKFVDGKPIFIKKPDGSYDNQAMFDIRFGKVRLYDNPPMELSSSLNHIDYNTMVANDPFWVSDAALLDKLYSAEFNYRETKYMGIQTVYDMMKVMYESSFYFKMIFDNKTALSKSTIYYSNTGTSVNIFDMAVYVSALVCRKYGYAGNIASELPSIAKILGFNFKEDLTVLKANLTNNKYLGDDVKLLALIKSMDINSLTSVATVYNNILELRESKTVMWLNRFLMVLKDFL